MARPPLSPLERGGYTFWSTDYHIAPIADIVDLFESLCSNEGLCMKVSDQSFSGACARTFGGRKPSCASGLRVLTQANAFDACASGGPHAFRRKLFEAYRGPSSPLQHVDAFVCNHPPALCELYMPFNKSLVVIASVNLEFGRENPSRWGEWLDSLQRIAADRRNVVAANNWYDAEYITYFTGIQAEVIPSYCGYAASKATYRPDFNRPLLFGRNHNNPSHIYSQLHHAAASEGRASRSTRAGVSALPEVLRFVRTEDHYPSGFEYSQLARHPAVIVVPYTKSVMTFFEMYRMNIPLFAPSLPLLVSWEQRFSVMAERIYWSSAPRPTTPFPNSTTLNPNTRKSHRAMRHWLALSDIYTFPHVILFDSAEHLVQLLRSTDLEAVSAKMAKSNRRMLRKLRSSWRRLFLRMFEGQPPGHRLVPTNYDDAMLKLYGKVPSAAEPSCARESRPEHGQWN